MMDHDNDDEDGDDDVGEIGDELAWPMTTETTTTRIVMMM